MMQFENPAEQPFIPGQTAQQPDEVLFILTIFESLLG
jgi:hypothetical protein